MNRSKTRFIASWCVLSAALLLTVTSCGRSSGGGGRNGDAPVQETDFDAFVIDLIQNETADDAEPVEINGLNFQIDEDEGQFDELFTDR